MRGHHLATLPYGSKRPCPHVLTTLLHATLLLFPRGRTLYYITLCLKGLIGLASNLARLPPGGVTDPQPHHDLPSPSILAIADPESSTSHSPHPCPEFLRLPDGRGVNCVSRRLTTAQGEGTPLRINIKPAPSQQPGLPR